MGRKEHVKTTTKFASATVQHSVKNRYEIFLFPNEIFSLKDINLPKQNLRTLIVIGQSSITSLDEISKLIHLQELWVIECQIKKVSNLQNCIDLKKLYLYSNDIDEIPNLSNCRRLTLLSLSGNNVSHLKNLETMPHLRELHLANNKLKKLDGNVLSQNTQLRYLNLAGNPLYQLNVIKIFSSLPKLKSVVFADPLYGECPLASLCNYRHFTNYFLPRIKELDYYPVSDEEKRHVNDFFKNKMTFYNMLWHKYLNAYLQSKKIKCREYNQGIKNFKEELYATKIKQLLTIKSEGNFLHEQDEHETLQEINLRLKLWCDQLKQWEDNASIHMEILQRQLSLKMQHCGNLNFVEYTSSSKNSLVQICRTILEKSLCLGVKKSLGIMGIRLNQVTKVLNKETNALRSWNDAEQEYSLQEADIVFKFLESPSGVTELQKWPFDIFRNEFFDEKEVVVTDCLAIADADWLFKLLAIQRNTNMTNLPNVQRTHRICILVQLPASALTVKVENADKYHAIHDDYENETCQRFNVNPAIAKPVFAVEYEYVFQTNSKNDKMIEIAEKPIAQMLWSNLTKDNISHCLGTRDILNLVRINLTGQGIASIDISIDLPNLKELDISYNQLTSLPRSQILKYVRKLDVSFNNIRSLHIALRVSQLEDLDFSWNDLTKFMTSLQTLKDFAPNLHRLNLKNNPFNDVFEYETMLPLAQTYLSKLHFFNETPFKDFCLFPVKHFSWMTSLFEKVENKFEHTNLPEVISETNKGLTTLLSPTENKYERIKTIDLSYNLMDRLDFVQEFPALQELCISNNLLKKTLLDKPLKYLIKLNLSGNFILSLKGLTQSNLPVLKYLDLTNNLVKSLLPMETYVSLREFYCSHNQISKLKEMCNLKNWSGLQIIDLCNNPIDSIALCRKFLIFHLACVKYVCGQCVQKSDIVEASHAFGGFLDKNTLTTMHNVGVLMNIKQLSIVNCSFKRVDLPSNALPNLESLDLSKNQITSLWGLHSLPKLQTLCLSHNQIEKFKQHSRKKLVSDGNTFSNLLTLYLDHNDIHSLVDLNLQRMPVLKYLFLQYNNIQNIDGIQLCTNLETLILDYNKIRVMTEDDFHVNNNIRILLLGNNKMKYLYFVRRLQKLEKFFVANNKITDKDQLKYLSSLKHLKELMLLGNPLCRRMNHYKFLLQALDTLEMIDGQSILLEDYYLER